MKNNTNNDFVTILKVTKKGNKYLVSSSLDELVCTEDQLVEDRIFKGKNFTLAEWDNIKNNQETALYFSKALNYISYKLRTVKEIRIYLKEFSLPDEKVNIIINKLIDYKFLDDERYVKTYIDSQIKNKKGPKFIEYNLKQKGISEKFFFLINELYDRLDIEENIYNIIEKELPKLKNNPIIKQKEKLKNKLLRDGYTEPLISNGIKKFTFSEDISDKILKDYNLLVKKDYSKLKIKQKLYAKGYSIKDINNILKDNE